MCEDKCENVQILNTIGLILLYNPNHSGFAQTVHINKMIFEMFKHSETFTAQITYVLFFASLLFNM